MPWYEVVGDRYAVSVGPLLAVEESLLFAVPAERKGGFVYGVGTRLDASVADGIMHDTSVAASGAHSRFDNGHVPVVGFDSHPSEPSGDNLVRVPEALCPVLPAALSTRIVAEVEPTARVSVSNVGDRVWVSVNRGDCFGVIAVVEFNRDFHGVRPCVMDLCGTSPI